MWGVIILDENLPSQFLKELTPLLYLHSLEWINDPHNRLGLYPGMEDDKIISTAWEYDAYIVTYNGRHFKNYPKAIPIPYGWKVTSEKGLRKGLNAILIFLINEGYADYADEISLH